MYKEFINMIFMKYCIFVFLILLSYKSLSQTEAKDTFGFSALNKTRLSFILDDIYFFAGATYSGIYYSNQFRDLTYRPGMTFGVEQYIPMSGKWFLTTGVNISQRNFMHNTKDQVVRVNNLYLNSPVAASFELPILRNYDLRFMLGANIGVRMNSNLGDSYLTNPGEPSNYFVYDTDDFHKWDWGWLFGFSIEHRAFIFRTRCYAGFRKFDNKDQGMMNSFSFEIGYFLFRN
jgi:hypothetical protein